MRRGSDTESGRPAPTVDEAPPRTLVQFKQDRRALIGAAALLLVVFCIGAAVQAVYAYDYRPRQAQSVSLGLRVAVNAAAVLTALGLFWWVFGLVGRGGRIRILVLPVVVIVPCAVRVIGQHVVGIYGSWDLDILLVEAFSTAVVVCIALTVGLVHMLSLRRIREQTLRGAAEAQRAGDALLALQAEEVRVRQDVADGLHGTLQGRLVVLGSRLDGVVARLESDGRQAEADEVRAVRTDLDELRANDVRAMGHLLYPAGLDLGATAAVRTLLRRLPDGIGTELSVDEGWTRLDDPIDGSLDAATRLLVVRVVEEAVTNALKHGLAASVQVRLQVAAEGGPDRPVLVVEVLDDGVGLPPDLLERSIGGQPPVRPGPGGLGELRRRLQVVGGALTLRAGAVAGTAVVATIPVREPISPRS